MFRNVPECSIAPNVQNEPISHREQRYPSLGNDLREATRSRSAGVDAPKCTRLHHRAKACGTRIQMSVRVHLSQLRREQRGASRGGGVEPLRQLVRAGGVEEVQERIQRLAEAG